MSVTLVADSGQWSDISCLKSQGTVTAEKPCAGNSLLRARKKGFLIRVYGVSKCEFLRSKIVAGVVRFEYVFVKQLLLSTSGVVGQLSSVALSE